MESQDKACIEYALHVYDILWDYYKKTLDERNRILNNYILIVGIPISIIGMVVEKVKDNIQYYSNGIFLVLTIILLFGIVIYDAYIVESFISERYLKQIKYITQFLIQHYDNSHRNVFSEIYSLDRIFLNREESSKHRLKKSFLTIMSNTVIIIIMVYLRCLNQTKWYYVFLASVISVFIHMMIFAYHKRNEDVNML